MDADKENQEEEEEQAVHHHSTEQRSKLSGRATSFPRSSIDSQGSAAGMGADADLPSDTEGTRDGYRRPRAQPMANLENGIVSKHDSSKKHSRRHRNVSGAPDEENKQLVYSSDEGHGSEFSSRTTSEDFELDHLAADDPFSDDEETEMAKKYERRRKRRRRKAGRMDERFPGDMEASKPDKQSTYRQIYRAWIINALLVASWYVFSLSISIVSEDMQPSVPPTRPKSF